MVNTKRFKRIRTLHDIEMEKARLKYELLLAENRLMEDIDVVRGFFTQSSLFSKASEAISYISSFYNGFQGILGWLFRKKERRA